MELSANEVQVWLGHIEDGKWLEHLGMLSGFEQARYRRFSHQRAAAEYLAARVMTRVLLSRISGSILPKDVGVESPEGKKPFATNLDVEFNISHSHGQIAVAIANFAIGIDIEGELRGENWRNLSDRILDPSESNEIAGHPEAIQSLRFMQYWSLKEAVSKSLGEGLSFPFDEIVLRLGKVDLLPQKVEVADPGKAMAREQQAWLLKGPEGFQLAVAMARQVGSPQILVRRFKV